jgi:(1->4)-alpha-D-glucan 1-alpha-D-glucosylmutase
VLTHGDYQPLEVTGPRRDHIVAFARRRGREAAIIAVAKSYAALSRGGRDWPGAEAFDAALQLSGYSAEGIGGASEVPLSMLFRHLPVAVLKASFEGALKPVRKRVRA